ncbi:hypothetical protein K7711_26700 [Nocardia sp. CA2R105]|uniref:hypothetical protein n=1 Tax=Nocardia coffeae TaxID=2873381 RepID=UPI001CA603BC|nr:hypothetical protein [Nocardia coffeae]MBY8860086.1 hypothetical protein [Nocardia coffeae]
MTETGIIAADVAQAASALALGQLIAVFPEPTNDTGSGINAGLLKFARNISNSDNQAVYVYEQGAVWQDRQENKQTDSWDTNQEPGPVPLVGGRKLRELGAP